MIKNISKFVVFSILLGVLSQNTNAQSLSSKIQSSSSNLVTPFDMLLDMGRNLDVPADEQINRSKATVGKQKQSNIKYRQRPGMHVHDYIDENGGQVVVDRLSGVEDLNADNIRYSIAAGSIRAKNLMTLIREQYGTANEQRGNMQIWYIQNPDIRDGQAKIITLRAQEVNGQISISADRTPITRRRKTIVDAPPEFTLKNKTLGEPNVTKIKPAKKQRNQFTNRVQIRRPGRPGPSGPYVPENNPN